MEIEKFEKLESNSTEQAVLKLMETPEGRENIFLCYYEWDANSAFQRFYSSEEWNAVLRLLSQYPPPSMKALDLGAGNGIGTYALNKSGYLVTSLEPDPSELVGYGALKKVLKLKTFSVYPVSGYGESLPFKDQIFGLVYLRQVLHHSKELKKMMNEISRVLMPGGIFIATREHVVDDDDSLEAFLRNHALHKYTKSESAFLQSEYLLALEGAGFKLKKLLLSWDSVINYYPMTDAILKQNLYKSLRDKVGPLSGFFSKLPGLVELYKRIKSYKDRTPGRMISFVAKKKNRDSY
jgi:ubiquinone/menaquinone biosynthesis C-methylase UbiE